MGWLKFMVITMDRANNPFDGSRRLKSATHKSLKDYNRQDNKRIEMEDNNRQAVDFDNLLDKVNEHMMIYGNLDLLSEYERSRVDEWQIPIMKTFNEFDKASADEFNTTMAFGLNCKDPRTLNKVERHEEQNHYNYIGAPGGEEWAILNIWEVDAGVYGIIRGTDYPADKKISISQVEENFHKQAAIEIDKYYVGNAFNAQAAIQDGVPPFAVVKHMLDNKDYSGIPYANINKGLFSYTHTKPPIPIKRDEKVSNKTYRPLPDCLTIKESSIDGLGLFATVDIDKDVTLGITHHYIDVGFKDELIRTPLSGFLNHSPKPNVTIEEFENGKGRDHTYKNYRLVTLRPISLGEEILVDYQAELCGLSGYDGAEFLEDKLEDRVYKNKDGILYYYNSTYGKFESTYGTPNNNPIFYTPEDAEIFLKRIE